MIYRNQNSKSKVDLKVTFSQHYKQKSKVNLKVKSKIVIKVKNQKLI